MLVYLSYKCIVDLWMLPDTGLDIHDQQRGLGHSGLTFALAPKRTLIVSGPGDALLSLANVSIYCYSPLVIELLP